MPDSSKFNTSNSFQLNQKFPNTLVIHCADPRFRAAFETYIRRELRTEHYTLISVPGGAGSFVFRDSQSGEVKVMLEPLRLFLARPELTRVLAFNHDLCLWYANALPQLEGQPMVERQTEDLRQFADSIHSEYSHVRVETFMASVEGDRIRFKPEP